MRVTPTPHISEGCRGIIIKSGMQHMVYNHLRLRRPSLAVTQSCTQPYDMNPENGSQKAITAIYLTIHALYNHASLPSPSTSPPARKDNPSDKTPSPQT